MFISIEGPDCSGKSAVVKELRLKFPEAIFVREPGTTLFGERIREILLNSSHNLEPISELLLFTSSFCETSSKVIMPALKEGKLVIADRWYFSTIAYQCYATSRNKEYHLMHDLMKMDGISKPMVNFILTAPWDVLKKRMAMRSGAKDNFEKRDESYQRKIYEYYNSVCVGEKISTDCNIEETLSSILSKIKKY